MQVKSWIIALGASAALSGCLTTNSDVNNAALGAAVGAAAAVVLDGDPLVGAVAGAGAGALCDDAGVCN